MFEIICCGGFSAHLDHRGGFFLYLINIEISAAAPIKGGRAIKRTRRSLQRALLELKKRSEIISNFMNVLCGVNPKVPN